MRRLLIGAAWSILCGFIGLCMLVIVVYLTAKGISR